MEQLHRQILTDCPISAICAPVTFGECGFSMASDGAPELGPVVEVLGGEAGMHLALAVPRRRSKMIAQLVAEPSTLQHEVPGSMALRM